MSIGSSGGTAVKSAALVVAPLGLAVFACCGHRSLPRQLAVLPNGMVPGTICPGCRIRIFGWSCVFLRSFVTSRCVVHHVRHQSSYFVRRPPLMPPPRCSVKHNNCNRSGPGTLFVYTKNAKSTETADTTTYQVVWYFDSRNQNVRGDANSCPLTANTFRPERDSAKQTKLICVVCILPVNRAISIGKKLEGN